MTKSQYKPTPHTHTTTGLKMYSNLALWMCLLASAVLAAPPYTDNIESSLHRVRDSVYPSRIDEHGRHLSYNLLYTSDQLKHDRQYFRLNAFERTFILNVTASESSFISMDHKVEYHHTVNGVRTSNNSTNCLHLTGMAQEENIESHPEGWTAISICQGMRGILATEDGYLYIEPSGVAPDNLHTNKHQHHIYYTNHPIDHNDNTATCGFDKTKSNDHSNIPQQHYDDDEVRVRRSPVSTSISSEHWVEVAMVADHTMLNYHGAQELEAYLFTLMNMDTISTSSNGLNTLDGFCHWQATNSLVSSDGQDITILVTRSNICEGFGGTCGTLGIAEFRGACNPQKSCSISEDIGLATAFTIAHELGHSLGIRHDGDVSVICEPNNNYIMAPSFVESHNPHIWSHCSRQQLEQFLQSPDSSCLSNEPVMLGVQEEAEEDDNSSLSVPLPGLEITPTEQCQLMLEDNALHCQPNTTNIEFCSRLWCRENDQSDCRHYHIPPASGTECTLTSGRGGVCYQGACVEFGSLVNPVEGGWGEWGEWEECSLTCGTGVQGSSRSCDSPVPANGGRYCLGASHRHQTCNTMPCTNSNGDIRQELCNTEPPHTRYTEWRAPSLDYISRRNLDQCSHHCLSQPDDILYTLNMGLPDGTSCLYTSDPSPSHSLQLSSVPESLGVCVSGECIPVGCNNTLRDIASRDVCGVWCGNGSTCVPVSDIYTIIEQNNNDTSEYVYHETITIPRGSGRVKINEIHPMDNLYLAAMTTTENFNGNYRVKDRLLKSYWFAGTRWWYARPEEGIECLRTDGVVTDDVTIFIISNTRTNLSIHYSAGIPTDVYSVMYVWWVREWGECNGDCGEGVRERTVECILNDTDMILDDGLCDSTTTRPDSQQTCYTETECNYQWRVSPWTNCNTTCGYGVATRTIQCVLTNNQTVVDSLYCANEDAPIINMECHSVSNCSYQWQSGNWSTCSTLCGNGERRRDNVCILTHNMTSVSKDKCTDPPPVDSEGCSSDRGCVYMWEVGIWNKCSSVCGQGLSTRQVNCILTNNNTPVSDSYCNNFTSAVMPSNSTVCYSEDGCIYDWYSGEWNECSETCGIGMRSRNLTCILTNNATTVADSYCTNRPDTTTQCFNDSGCIYEWNTTEWTECDIDCGWSERARYVTCILRNNNTIVDEYYCGDKTRPSDSSSCYTEDGCVYQWWYGNWTACSMDCGHGMRTRQIACYLINNNTQVDNHRCSSNMTPAETTDCHDDSGCRYTWRTEQWSQCNETCGEGHVTRSVNCILDNNNTIVKDIHCSSTARPSVNKSCYDESMCVFQWTTDSWSNCSAICGEGEKIRNVKCLLVNNDTLVANEYCYDSGSEPVGVASCEADVCQFEWEVGDWGECAGESCEDGTKKRNVQCILMNNQSLVNETWCVEEDRPDDNVSCQFDECLYEWTVGEWGNCDAGCGLGEKEREVYCELLNGREGKRRVDGEMCGDSDKPIMRRSCRLQSCSKYNWRKGKWSKCDAECDMSGFRTRNVTCEHEDGTVVPDSPYCTSRKAKPRKIRPCRGKCETECVDVPQTPCNLVVDLRLCTNRNFLELCCQSCTSPNIIL